MARKGKEKTHTTRKEDLQFMKAAARGEGGEGTPAAARGSKLGVIRRYISRPSAPHRMETMAARSAKSDNFPPAMDDLEESTFSIDIGLSKPGGSSSTRSKSKGRRSSFEWDALNIPRHPKRVSFKADNAHDAMFSETKNIINLASLNNFSSSLFDSYEIKALSKYVLSIEDENEEDSDGDSARRSGKWWKDLDFSYDMCLPRASISKMRFHLPLPKYGPALCGSTQVIFSTRRVNEK